MITIQNWSTDTVHSFAFSIVLMVDILIFGLIQEIQYDYHEIQCNL